MSRGGAENAGGDAAAGEFKAKCLELMDRVQREGIELVITKRGKPVAKLVPAEVRTDSPFGYMKGTFRITGEIVKTQPDEYERCVTVCGWRRRMMPCSSTPNAMID